MSTKWHKGPPPSIGWWQASNARQSRILRWWNGVHWSEPVHVTESAEKAARIAKFRDYGCSVQDIYEGIEWKHRPKSWPARSHT